MSEERTIEQLVARLRRDAYEFEKYTTGGKLLYEAADALERLRAERDAERTMRKQRMNEMQDEIDLLERKLKHAVKDGVGDPP